MNTLFLIPARGGSKGIPGKNIKELNGKPLICYSIDLARKFADDVLICVSTDSDEIISVVENYGLGVPFKRPAELATDTAGSHEVILHAIDFYEKQGVTLDNVVLLQPTSPFRLQRHLQEALSLYNDSTDLVVSVKEVKKNIHALYYRTNAAGYIEKAFSSENRGSRRQEAEELFELNGSLYVINAGAVKHSRISELTRVAKVVMDERYSADIDEPLDWAWCEFLLKENLVNLD